MSKRRRSRIFWYGGMCIALLLLSNRTEYLKATIVDYVSSYAVYPLLILDQKIVAPIKSYFAHKKTNAELLQAHEQLRHEKDDLLARVIELEAALRYAHDVEELVGFKKEYEGLHTSVVHIIARNISDQTHFILVDAGSHKGITKDMVAIYKNGLVGKVEEVYPFYSKVMLITDSACKVAACSALTNAVGIHEGCNAMDRTAFTRVSHLQTVQEGDLVLSSGQGLIFPRGFGLGTIKSHTADGLTYQIAVEPLFDVRTLNHCFIVQKGVLKKDFFRGEANPKIDAPDL